MIAEGASSFTVTVARAEGVAQIRVASYRPASLRPDAPILIVLHGVMRNALSYRDAWIPEAEARGLLLLAPEFSRSTFPTPREYEVGCMRDAQRRPLPRGFWSYAVVEQVFDTARAAAGLGAERYHLYGHSAGGQFVHRMITFMPEARVAAAVAANAGCYTMPTVEPRFPYGLGEMAAEADLGAAFRQRLTLLLGERDDDPNHHQLLKSPEAMEQGPHRLARGRRYFEVARQMADALSAPFLWRLETVADVGHSNARLVPHAARALFERA